MLDLNTKHRLSVFGSHFYHHRDPVGERTTMTNVEVEHS